MKGAYCFQEEIEDLWETVRKARDFLEENYAPRGFNVGFNVGETAGQTIDQVHIHVIPRFEGDMEGSTGGVRHVIPEKGKYYTIRKRITCCFIPAQSGKNAAK